MIRQLNIYVPILSIFFCSTAWSSPTCEEYLQASKPNPASNTFLQSVIDILGSISPYKKADIKSDRFKSCGDNCVELPNTTGITYRVVFTPSIIKPELLYSTHSKTLLFPDAKFLNTPNVQDIFRQFLVGHSLHPYTSTTLDNLYLKPAQIMALQAFDKALKENARSFLHVAPTSLGKGIVLVEALAHKLIVDHTKKISIVTVDKIDLVDQIKEDLALNNVNANIVNINEYSNTDFEEYVFDALVSDTPTVFTITTQSLKSIFYQLPESSLKTVLDNLDAIYVDEAHHLGAKQTQALIADIMENSSAFLYATTATPVHASVEIQDLFERVHWSYLHTKDNLYGSYSTEQIMDQLNIAMDMGEITPFSDFYVLGEPNFEHTSSHPLLIQADNLIFVVNPHHYLRLAHMLSPLINSNKKGFIVASNISEADRIADFLSSVFTDTVFESYHSQLSTEQRQSIFQNSKDLPRHFIVAVRALDEGVNLPQLSAYIDLNTNVSVKQMIHRIGRILRLHPGKITSDILFLVNYKNESMVRDLLSTLDATNNSNNNLVVRRIKNSESEVRHINPISVPQFEDEFTYDDLARAKELLAETAKKFWEKDQNSDRWLSYQEAQVFVKLQDIRSSDQFKRWSQTGHRPPNIPARPEYAYARTGEWTSWSDFLGTHRSTPGQYLPYEEVKKFINDLGIKTRKAYWDWSKSQRNVKIPSNPVAVYKEEWVNWASFFETKNVFQKPFMKFEDAKALMLTLNFKNHIEFLKWSKSNERPFDFPSNPSNIYVNEWTNWESFLGREKQEYLSYAEASAFIIKVGLKTKTQFLRWRKDNRPANIPFDPSKFYSKTNDWISWDEFLGTQSKAKPTFLDFEDARAFVRSQNFKGQREFRLWLKSDQRVDTIPSNPHVTYKDSWVSWGDFLGNGNISNALRTSFISYSEAKKLMAELGIKNQRDFRSWSSSPARPDNVPSAPNRTYKSEWTSWTDFFKD